MVGKLQSNNAVNIKRKKFKTLTINLSNCSGFTHFWSIYFQFFATCMLYVYFHKIYNHNVAFVKNISYFK